MRVLILDTLLKQMKALSGNTDKISDSIIFENDDKTVSGRIDKRIYKRILAEYDTLYSLEKEGRSALNAYIRQQNGKPMRGIRIKDIYKYRLTDGDRIIYTRGNVLGYLPPEDDDSLVLLAYAKNDEQEAKIRSIAADVNIEHTYMALSEFCKTAKDLGVAASNLVGMDEFNEEDQNAFYDLILNPSFIQGHKIQVFPDEDYLELDPDMQDVALSATQDKVRDEFNGSHAPMLILGGAGTGKTVICMHILNDFDNSVDKQTGIYFTQSRELLGKVENKSKYICPRSPNKNDILYYDVNEFCLELLGTDRKKLVETRQFVDYINSHNELAALCDRQSIDPMVVWTEIRGTVKGYMGSKWIRTRPMFQGDFATNIKSLVDKGYFVRNQKDSRYIELIGSVSEIRKRYKKDDSLSDEEKINIKNACDHFSRFDHAVRALTREQYFGLPDEDTTVEQDRRSVVWDIYEAYDSWLEANDFFDENDLVLKVLEIHGEELPECNLAVVDEVQDYTELQLYLIYRMVDRSKGRIVFAGDVKQNVNPTFFSEDHLKMLFCDGNGKPTLNVRRLTANFRCSGPIVETANKISDLRKKTIGSLALDDEEPESAKRDGKKPYRLLYNEENIKHILETLMEYPRVAMLVPDAATKDELIDLIGKDRYESESLAHFIFTVSEIKGMEYAYVVCYNLSSQYEDVWKRIFYTDSAKKKTKYRYYFNVLYVAATRAESFLCFIDHNTLEKLESCLELPEISTFNAEKLYFTSLSTGIEEQIKQAGEFLDAGRYEDALHIYKRVGRPEDVYRCKILISEEERDYDSAIKYHMLVEENRRYKYVNEIEPESQIRLLHDAIYAGRKIGAAEKVLPVLRQYYSEDEQNIMLDRLINRYDDHLSDAAGKIAKAIN